MNRLPTPYSPLPVFFLLFASAANLSAGDLTPPAGPVTPTQRTPINAATTPGDANSVFRITAPGSYVLTGNITGQAARHGIEIAADGVTLDLMGFEIAGVPTSLDGITNEGGRSNITVRNGLIRDFAQDGVDLLSSVNLRVEDLTCRLNASGGLRIGPQAVVERCIAASNTVLGFMTSRSTNVVNCVATANGQGGFLISGPASGAYIGCTAELNGGSGFEGGGSFTFLNCMSKSNSGSGFRSSQDGSTLSNCYAIGNTSNGIFTLVGNVTNCVSRSNGGSGIVVSTGHVSNCTAVSNGQHGIVMESDGAVLNNFCADNGSAIADGAGVRVQTSDVRVEGNNCTGGDRGIDVIGANNIIIRNVCTTSAGINYLIAANNVYGPIIDRTAPASAAVSGNAAASVLTTTDPHANFAY